MRRGCTTLGSLGALACAFLVTLSASAGAAPAKPKPNRQRPAHTVRIVVQPTRQWTDPKISLSKGDTVDIAATGFMHFGGEPIAYVSPAGKPWGKQCFQTLAPTRADFPAPGERCWSLLAVVGSGTPQEIGTSGTVTAEQDGPLYLGPNDNYMSDNGGAWPASITVYQAPKVRATGVMPASHTRRNSLYLLWVLLGVLVLVYLGRKLWKYRPKRREAFKRTNALLVGQARIRVKRSGEIERIGDDGDAKPFALARADFLQRLPAARHERFSFRGLNFLPVKSRMPFAPRYGEVRRVGQHVVGSEGVVKGNDRFLRGRVPLSLEPAWVFTLDAAAGGPEFVEGDLTVITGETHFDDDSAAIARTLRKLGKRVDTLTAFRQNTVPLTAAKG